MTTFVYVEGGGDNRLSQSACRAGLAALVEKVVPPGRLPRVVACGSRNAAFDQFKTRISRKAIGDVVLLLVDSEGPVSGGITVWAHVTARDGWVQPPGTTHIDLHFMVECTEAWFLADQAALMNFYGAGFRPNALPANPNVELVAKADVLDGLRRATVGTRRGEYHKARHGFDLLALLDPGVVRGRSVYADRFFKALV